MLNLKHKFLFIEKKIHKKLISRHNTKTNTLTRQEYKGKIYVKNIRKNSCKIRNQLKSRIRIQQKKTFRIQNTACQIGHNPIGIKDYFLAISGLLELLSMYSFFLTLILFLFIFYLHEVS